MQTSATSAAILAFSPTHAERCASAEVPSVCAALSCGVPSHLQPRDGAAESYWNASPREGQMKGWTNGALTEPQELSLCGL
jgi:hypothetical protein